jgi:hypothetical protein
MDGHPFTFINLGFDWPSAGRRIRISDEDVSHHFEHAHAQLLWHLREPWRGMQSITSVSESPLPPLFHQRAAKLIVL